MEKNVLVNCAINENSSPQSGYFYVILILCFIHCFHHSQHHYYLYIRLCFHKKNGFGVVAIASGVSNGGFVNRHGNEPARGRVLGA